MPEMLEQNTLEAILVRGSSARWCVKSSCSTCPCPQMREIIGEGRRPPYSKPSKDRVKQVCRELAAIDRDRLRLAISKSQEFTLRSDRKRTKARPRPGEDERFGWCEDAVMWLLHRVWVLYGDEAHSFAFPPLRDSWAGGIYQRMRNHYARTDGRRHWFENDDQTITRSIQPPPFQ
jgi:hypothetical protein